MQPTLERGLQGELSLCRNRGSPPKTENARGVEWRAIVTDARAMDALDGLGGRVGGGGM